MLEEDYTMITFPERKVSMGWLAISAAGATIIFGSSRWRQACRDNLRVYGDTDLL